MTITVSIPDELAEVAKARGFSFEAYVQEILARQFVRPAETRRRGRAHNEEIRAGLDSLAQVTGPVRPHLWLRYLVLLDARAKTRSA
jgi:post-segregation antitoxin (ccd killing protein)